MSRTPAPRSDPRSTRELVRDGREADHAEHVAERLECAARRGHREERDEQTDRILVRLVQRVDDIAEAVVGDGVSAGLAGRIEAAVLRLSAEVAAVEARMHARIAPVEAAQARGARLVWVLVGTLFAAGGTVLAAVLTHGWQR